MTLPSSISLKASLIAVTALIFGLHVIVSVTQARAEPVKWKLHSVFVDSRPETKFAAKFAKLVAERTKGELLIEVYGGGTLGVKDADMLRLLPEGRSLQIAVLQPVYMSRDAPDFATTLPGGALESVDRVAQVQNILLDSYRTAYDKWGVELIGLVGLATRDTHVFCKEPVNTLEALKSKKVRVWERFHILTLNKLGIAAQNIPQNDLYLAMQTGVVDCAVYIGGVATTISLQEVAPYGSYLFPFAISPLTLIASKKAFNQLKPEIQKIVRDTADEIWKESLAAWIDGSAEKEGLKAYQDKGGKMIEPFSAKDQKAFTDAAREVWEELTKAATPAADANRRAILQAVAK